MTNRDWIRGPAVLLLLLVLALCMPCSSAAERNQAVPAHAASADVVEIEIEGGTVTLPAELATFDVAVLNDVATVKPVNTVNTVNTVRSPSATTDGWRCAIRCSWARASRSGDSRGARPMRRERPRSFRSASRATSTAAPGSSSIP